MTYLSQLDDDRLLSDSKKPSYLRRKTYQSLSNRLIPNFNNNSQQLDIDNGSTDYQQLNHHFLKKANERLMARNNNNNNSNTSGSSSNSSNSSKYKKHDMGFTNGNAEFTPTDNHPYTAPSSTTFMIQNNRKVRHVDKVKNKWEKSNHETYKKVKINNDQQQSNHDSFPTTIESTPISHQQQQLNDPIAKYKRKISDDDEHYNHYSLNENKNHRVQLQCNNNTMTTLNISSQPIISRRVPASFKSSLSFDDCRQYYLNKCKELAIPLSPKKENTNRKNNKNDNNNTKYVDTLNDSLTDKIPTDIPSASSPLFNYSPSPSPSPSSSFWKHNNETIQPVLYLPSKHKRSKLLPSSSPTPLSSSSSISTPSFLIENNKTTRESTEFPISSSNQEKFNFTLYKDTSTNDDKGVDMNMDKSLFDNDEDYTTDGDMDMDTSPADNNVAMDNNKFLTIDELFPPEERLKKKRRSTKYKSWEGEAENKKISLFDCIKFDDSIENIDNEDGLDFFNDQEETLTTTNRTIRTTYQNINGFDGFSDGE
ncbi:hypothetical protein BJ944DRAFT_263177 [Cunninghamella echinulata]|nr:hypothetical protein BJ944DRAFT_263177 [Cunninghamella echinulata]